MISLITVCDTVIESTLGDKQVSRVLYTNIQRDHLLKRKRFSLKYNDISFWYSSVQVYVMFSIWIESYKLIWFSRCFLTEMRSILNVLVGYSCCLLLVNSPRWESRVKLKFREQSSNKFKVIFVHEQQINATLKNNLFKLTMYFQTILTGIWNWMKVLQRYKVKAFLSLSNLGK